MKVASEPEALLAVLKNSAYHFNRIGLEAGPLSQWLFGALAEAESPVVCVETRHMQAVLKARIDKTDRNDARGIAQMMRVGLYRLVHVKTLRSQRSTSTNARGTLILLEGPRRPASLTVLDDEVLLRKVAAEIAEQDGEGARLARSTSCPGNGAMPALAATAIPAASRKAVDIRIGFGSLWRLVP